jgi:hypothetical protein
MVKKSEVVFDNDTNLNEEPEPIIEAIKAKVVTIDDRLYLSFDILDKNYKMGVPALQTAELYKKANEGKGYPIHEDENTRVWRDFCTKIRGNKEKPRTIVIKAMNIVRTREMINNKIKDIFFVYLSMKGENSKEMTEEAFGWFGIWQEPKWTKDRNENTEELEVTGVAEWISHYEFTLPENKDLLKYLIDHSLASNKLYVKTSADASESIPVIDNEGFQKATYPELYSMGKAQITYNELRTTRKHMSEEEQKKDEEEQGEDTAE